MRFKNKVWVFLWVWLALGFGLGYNAFGLIARPAYLYSFFAYPLLLVFFWVVWFKTNKTLFKKTVVIYEQKQN